MSRPDAISVVVDPAFDVHRVGVPSTLWWWLPTLGPSAMLALQLLVSSGPAQWQVSELALRLGLGHSGSKMWQTLDRLECYRAASFPSTDVMVVRKYLPALSRRLISRLPEPMALQYLDEYKEHLHATTPDGGHRAADPAHRALHPTG